MKKKVSWKQAVLIFGFFPFAASHHDPFFALACGFLFVSCLMCFPKQLTFRNEIRQIALSYLSQTLKCEGSKFSSALLEIETFRSTFPFLHPLLQLIGNKHWVCKLIGSSNSKHNLICWFKNKETKFVLLHISLQFQLNLTDFQIEVDVWLLFEKKLKLSLTLSLLTVYNMKPLLVNRNFHKVQKNIYSFNDCVDMSSKKVNSFSHWL